MAQICTDKTAFKLQQSSKGGATSGRGMLQILTCVKKQEDRSWPSTPEETSVPAVLRAELPGFWRVWFTELGELLITSNRYEDWMTV